MNDTRPDPDRVLARLKLAQAQASRGRLKLFFGAAAGVGKTFAMLTAAHALREQQADVVIGVVETHGRADTEALVPGIERLPMKEVPHRDRILQEFDLDAALARRPKLVLVDELAHTNAPGSRHPKRWQDVEELLAAGIDVWTTMNVQHLDSLNDVVSGVTGVRVWETVPDRVFDEADEVVIVDLPPDELLQRLERGVVYAPQQAATASRNFFRKGNLIALRELALRRTADRVDGDMLEYRQGLSGAPVWATRESLLACIGPDDRSETIVRTAARLAAQLDVPWHCVYVETPSLLRLSDGKRLKILRVLQQAQKLGATTATLSGPRLDATLVKYAREHNLSRIVLGRDAQRMRRPWRGTLADAVGRSGADLDVMLVALPRRERNDARSLESHAGPHDDSLLAWRPYAMSLLVCAAVTLGMAPLHDSLELANIVMLFLLAVVVVAVRYGRGPAVMAAFVSVGAFDFFYVPPRFTFSVGDAQYLLTFAVMLIVALVIGQMTAGLKFQARVATSREHRMTALYEMSRDLSGALMAEQIAEVAERFLASEFDARAALMVADMNDLLAPPVPRPLLPGGVDTSIAQWAFDHQEAAGLGTDTLAGASILYLPLKAPMRVRGVLAIEPFNPARLLGPEQRRLLDTGASLLALSLERVHYVDVAQTSTVQMESELLRSSLLAAISHDLRTPLAALVGMADAMTRPALDPDAQRQIAGSMRDAAMRMNSLVNNLLDMARLDGGNVQLNRQWQPLEEVLGGALADMQALLDGRELRLKLPRDLPLLDIDAVLIERVLCNLLENAAKYTPPGSAIRIGAVLGSDRIEVQVDDDGPGLPEGREDAIFQKFERGRKESATAGVGLGLAICRAIVEAHGGTIRGETRPTGGARFSFSLPLGTPPTVEEEGIEPDAESASLGVPSTAPSPSSPLSRSRS